jgi:ABC-type multidrug transport system ATPase subunit
MERSPVQSLTTYRHRLSTIMRADRILVVMNGEIIEEGSHEDLIHSQGKYHDLWSKQIFVKPANESSRSRSPGKRDADIINDLSPGRQTAELAKVMKTTAHDEPGEQTVQQLSLPMNKQKPDDGNTAATPGHKREVRDGSR